MQSGSLYLGEFIFGDTGPDGYRRVEAGIDHRAIAGKPGLEALFGQHHRHARMQIVNAVASLAGQDCERQHAVLPLFPKPRKGQGLTILS